MGMKTSKNLKDLSTQNLNIYFKEMKTSGFWQNFLIGMPIVSSRNNKETNLPSFR